jgi:hypothetical protein
LNELLSSRFGDKIKVNLDFRTYSLTGGANPSDDLRGLGSLNLSWTNNRISFQVSGNFDFGLYNSANQSFSLLPNFIMEYKITPSGTVVGTIFVRNSIDVFNSTISNATGGGRKNLWVAGGGIAWRRESNDALEALGMRRKKRAAVKSQAN